MREYKVYGLMVEVFGRQVRAIVATTTKSHAIKLLKVSSHRFNGWSAETGNEVELRIALGKVDTVFYTSPNCIAPADKNYREFDEEFAEDIKRLGA